MALMCGSARVDITPEVGGMMDGYGLRREGSQGIAEPLSASVLVFQTEQTSGAIVAADVIGFPAPLAYRIRGRAAEALGTSLSCVMLTATHTHAGPSAGLLKDVPVDDAYWDGVEERIAGALVEAMSCLVPVKIKAGIGSVSFPTNRRKRDGTGVVIGTNDEGPVDRSVRTLCPVSEWTGRPVGILVHASCHPVALGGDNLLISPDYPVGLYLELKEQYGDTPVLFVNGSAGDVNPNRLAGESDMERRDRCGAELARAANGILEKLDAEATVPRTETRAETPPLRFVESPLRLPLEALPEPEMLDADVRALESQLEAETGPRRFVIERRLNWTREALGRRKEGAGTLWLDVSIQGVRIGDCVLVGLPFEVLTATGAFVLEAFPRERGRIFVCGYTNGAYGYLTPRAVLEEGGYEADDAHIWYGLPNRYAPEAEELVRLVAVDMLRDLGL